MVHPATPVVPPAIFTLFPFLSAATLDDVPAATGLFFLLPPPLDFFLDEETTVSVPTVSGELCVLGSSSWLRTLGKFFSPRALARAIASATMRLAFSCLHRISTRRTEGESPGDLVILIAGEAVVVVAEEPAADALITLTAATVPPAEAAEPVCVKRNRRMLFEIFVYQDVYLKFVMRRSTCGCRSILIGTATLWPP